MSKHSRSTLSLLVASAVGVGTVATVAQTLPDASSVPADLSSSADATATALVVPVQFFGGRRGHERGFGRGGRTVLMSTFQDADADNNGELTQSEIDQFLASQLTEADANADGSVSLEEFQTIYIERTRLAMVDAFQRLDEDGDGEVTSTELSDQFGTIVQRFDRNGDDVLSAEDRGRRGDWEGRRGRSRDDRR